VRNISSVTEILTAITASNNLTMPMNTSAIEKTAHVLVQSLFADPGEMESNHGNGRRLWQYITKGRQRAIVILINGWIFGKLSFLMLTNQEILVSVSP
jgi:hypothetical protein